MAREPKAILCPYCGLMQPPPTGVTPQAKGDSGSGMGGLQRCAACGGLFDALSRKATQIAMGPWYIRDKANPFRPGCSFEVLKKQIEAGRIKATTVLRGPTTRQFWAIARNTPGVGHLLGYCHRCGAKVDKTDVACPECAEPFMEPDERNELGLQFPTKHAVEQAQKSLERELEAMGRPSSSVQATTSSETPRAAKPVAAGSESRTRPSAHEPGEDLLNEILGPVQTGDLAAAPAAAVSQTPPPATTAARVKPGLALDFAPSGDDEGDDTASTAAAPQLYVAQSRSTQLIIWLLVGLNLLLLPVLIVALLYFMGVFNDESEQATQPALRSPVFDGSPDLTPTQPAVTVEPDRQQAVSMPTLTAGRQPEAEPPVESPVEPDPTAIPAPPTRTVADAANDAMAEALRREQAGELQSALSLMQDIERKTPPADQPVELASAMRRVQQKIERSEAAAFFGVPAHP